MSGIYGYGEPADWGSGDASSIMPMNNEGAGASWPSWMDEIGKTLSGGVRDYVNLRLGQASGNTMKTANAGGYTEGQRAGAGAVADSVTLNPMLLIGAGVLLLTVVLLVKR